MPPKRTPPPNDQPKPPNLKQITTQLQSIKDKQKRLDAEVRGLKDLLNVHDNWHSEIQKWIGEDVTVGYHESKFMGTLVWTDRYHVCVEGKGHRRIFPKGEIWIDRAD